MADNHATPTQHLLLVLRVNALPPPPPPSPAPPPLPPPRPTPPLLHTHIHTHLFAFCSCVGLGEDRGLKLAVNCPVHLPTRVAPVATRFGREKQEGRGKREEGTGKRERGRGKSKDKDGAINFVLATSASANAPGDEAVHRSGVARRQWLSNCIVCNIV